MDYWFIKKFNRGRLYNLGENKKYKKTKNFSD